MTRFVSSSSRRLWLRLCTWTILGLAIAAGATRSALADGDLNGLFLFVNPRSPAVVYFNITTQRTGHIGNISGSSTSVYVPKTGKRIVLRSDISGSVDFDAKTIVFRSTNTRDPSDINFPGSTTPVIQQAALTSDGFIIRGEALDGTISHAQYRLASEDAVNQAVKNLKR